jgi:hypothetical protein
MRIYSKISPDTLLHIIYTLDEMAGERNEIVPPNEFIQCAALDMERGRTFRPHKHIHRPVMHEAYIPQESWVVISGVVQVTYYDLDDTVLVTKFLYPGDVSITLQGGHNYLIHKRGVVYEFKSGPYLGQQLDKTFIDV